MSNMMKTAVFTGVREIELHEKPVPAVAGNKILVKVDAVALCTYEQRVYTGVNKVSFPYVGGHEVSAHIVALGESVDQNEWHIGDTVVVGNLPQCRNCAYCKSGDSQSCDHFNYELHAEGMPYRGMTGLSEYILASPDWLFHYSGVSALEAALIEPTSCVVHSVETADIQLGDTVLVIGAGIMGLLHTAIASKQGARVIVSDVNQERLAIAREVGAAYTVDPSKTVLPEYVRDTTGGMGVQVVFDTVPRASLVQDAFSCVANKGKIVLYSSIHPAEPAPFDPNWVHRKSIQILGTANSNDRDFIRASRLISQGIINVKPFISEVYPAEQVKDAFESAIKADKFRVLVTF